MKHTINKWRAIWKPELYHGWGKSRNYFEGWYFKMVTRDERKAIAFIPGISMDIDGRRHSFVQVIDGTEGKTDYFDFALEDFEVEEGVLNVHIANNLFSRDKVILDLPGITGILKLKNDTPMPGTLLSPGIMGWYSFVPFMQCYHGIVSFFHDLHGSLNFYGEELDFKEGIGYTEKDWGSSFPKCWIWMQSNHFGERDKISLMVSVAHIPWLGRFFVGFLVAFWYKDRLIRLATYTGAKMKSSLKGEKVLLSFRQGKEELRVQAIKGRTGSLISPISGAMVGKVNESLTATIELWYLKNGQIVYQGIGRNAGLEVAGDVDILLTDKEG